MMTIDSQDDDDKGALQSQPDSLPTRSIINDRTQATEVSLVA